MPPALAPAATPAALQQNDAPEAADTIREAAAHAAALGYSLVALHGVRDDGSCTCLKGAACLNSGKHPRENNWQRGAGTLKRFRQLTDGLTAFNVGLRLDANASVPLVVLDVDTKNDKPGLASLARLETDCGALPDTALLQTTPSGGRHYLLRLPDGVDLNTIPNRTDVLGGLDVLTHRRQFVLAPSRRATGAYRYVNERGLVAPSELPVLPAGWVEQLTALRAAKGASNRVESDADPAPDPTVVLRLLELLPAPAANSRDDCVQFAYAVHGALANADPEERAGEDDAFMGWADRWPGAVREKDEAIWESTRGARHRGWRHVLSDAQTFIDRARAASHPEDAGVSDGANVTEAQALLHRIRSEEAQGEFEPDSTVTPASRPESDTGYSLAELLLRPELLEVPAPAIPYLAWPGLKTLLSAREKTGKSTLALAGAAAATCGHPFLEGRIDPQTVLWVTEEPLGIVVRRAKEMKAEPTRFVVLPIGLNPAQQLQRAMARWTPRIVVIDTLYRFAGVEDENDAAKWLPVFAQFDEITRADVALLLLVHATKTSKNGEYRGSSAIGGHVDLILEMSAPDSGAIRKVRAVGRIPVIDFEVRLRPDRLTFDVLGRQDRNAPTVRDVRAFLAANGSTTRSRLRRELGLGQPKVDDALKQLIADGAVVEDGGAYRIVAASEEFESAPIPS